MSRAGTRRTFLVGLGRFMMGATAAALVKPPVLYSFPSVIRIARPDEQEWVYAGNLAGMSSMEMQLRSTSYLIKFEFAPGMAMDDVYVRKIGGIHEG